MISLPSDKPYPALATLTIPDNLSPFLTTLNASYRVMTRPEVEHLSQHLAAYVPTRHPIICVDSSARPLAYLISRHTGSPVYPVKVPHFSSPEIIDSAIYLLTATEKAHALSPHESLRFLAALAPLNAPLAGSPQPRFAPDPALPLTRESALRLLAPLIPYDPSSPLVDNLESYYTLRHLPAIHLAQDLLAHTTFADLLESSPILVEEYVTQGSVLRSLNTLFSLFSADFSYQLLCYDFNELPQDPPDYLLYSYHHAAPTSLERTYPYENRLDLLGFYYALTPDGLLYYDLSQTPPPSQDQLDLAETTLQDLLPTLADLVNLLAPSLDHSSGLYLSPIHLFYLAVSALSESPSFSSFFDQCFEMVSPSWSPLDPAIHLAFTNTLRDALDLVLAHLAPHLVDLEASIPAFYAVLSYDFARRHLLYWSDASPDSTCGPLPSYSESLAASFTRK